MDKEESESCTSLYVPLSGIDEVAIQHLRRAIAADCWRGEGGYILSRYLDPEP